MVVVLATCLFTLPARAQVMALWVGQSYDCDASSQVTGLTTNVSWSSNGGYIDMDDIGFYCKVTPTQYWSGEFTVKCSWEYQLYYGGPWTKTSTSWTFSCKDNPITIMPSEMTLAVGQSDYVGMEYKYNNQYTDYSRAYYTCSGKVASVNRDGRVTGLKPGTEKIYCYSPLSNPMKVTYCTVTVEKVNPTAVRVSSPIPLEVEKTKTLSATLVPEYASADSKVWSIVSGGEYITLTSDGRVTGKWPGQAVVVCTVNGNLVSNQAVINVNEPAFTNQSITPSQDATGVSVFAKPSASFSINVLEDEQFSAIRLVEVQTGSTVEGTCAISGKTVTFTPAHPLKPLTQYQFVIPAGALRNKWESSFQTTLASTFTTSDYDKLTLSSSLPSGFVNAGEEISLTASRADATIYYTLDGQSPSKQSAVYTGPIVITGDTRLRAIASCEGYYDSDVLEADYTLSNMNILSRFPIDDQLFIYDDLNPHVKFSNAVVAGDNVSQVSLIHEGVPVEGQVIVADSSVYFVPAEPLQVGNTYTMTIPTGAVNSWQDEPNGEVVWTFHTGDFATAVSSGGRELSAAIKMDRQLLTWGRIYKSGNTSTGRAEFDYQLVPKAFLTDVASVSTGLMHHAAIKTDHSLWMWGRQYCGEFGNNSTTGSSVPVKTMDDVSVVSAGGQTTAIVKTDGTLWMCGRNDYGQIGDSTYIVRKTPVKVMDDVRTAKAGMCSSYAIKTDGTLWAWGRNDRHQLGDGTSEDACLPVKVMDDVIQVEAAADGSCWTAAVKTDGTLWIWGATQATPMKLMDDVAFVSAGREHVSIVKADGTLWSFGDNTFGQLGDGTTVASEQPKEILAFADSVASGALSTFALKRNGSVWAWGENSQGALGDGSTPSATAAHPHPTEIITGRPYGLLEGLTARKDTFLVVMGKSNIIDALPSPLCSDYADLTWASDDEGVCRVSGRGVVKGNNFGETDVTATIHDNEERQYQLKSHIIVLSEEEYWERIGADGPVTTGLIGDVNLDGSVTVTDVMMTVKYIINGQFNGFYYPNGDTNKDGNISISDVQNIVRILIGE